MSSSAEKIAALHDEHPEWCAADIAAQVGLGPNRVRVLARKIKIKLPRPGRIQAARGQMKSGHCVSVILSSQFYGDVRARAYGQNLSVSEHLRRLLEADLTHKNGG